MTSLFDLKFIVITGKGGVGRTTVAAALAHAAATRGKKVLIAQMESPERLGPLFGRPGPIGAEVIDVAEDIAAVNMTPRTALHEYALMTLRYEAVYRAAFENKAVRGFLAAIPGLDAYAMFGKAWFHTTETVKHRPKYDLVILDGPASGHALAMLRLPQAILDTVAHGPLIKDARQARELLADPERAAVVLVTLAEELPVRETAETADAVRGELRMPLGPLIVNALPSDRLSDPDVAAVLDGAARGTGIPAVDATLRVAASLRAHRATADEMLDRLRRAPALPLVTLPHIHTAELGPREIDRLASLLGAGLAAIGA